MRLLHRVGLAAASLTLVFGGQVALAPPAVAGTGLYYHVVDADNDPYTGIYLRNDPNDFNNATRITSRYVLYGTTVELVCGTWGQAIGPYANRRWHQIYVPSGYAAGQTGWMPDRYMDTPNVANQPTPGEPECGAAPPPPPPPPPPSRFGAVYYSPYDLGSFMPDSSASVVGKSYWQGGSCSETLNKVASVTPTYNANTNLTVTTLAGWSLGRIGPIDYLKAHPERQGIINYLVMIDPGSYDQLSTSCDNSSTINAKSVLYYWLLNNPSAQLVIFSGAKTEDRAHPSYVNGVPYYHRGIQEVYFPMIRASGGSAMRNRVLVCNYQGGQTPTNELHQQMFWDFDNYIDKPPIGNTCPVSGATPWHP